MQLKHIPTILVAIVILVVNTHCKNASSPNKSTNTILPTHTILFTGHMIDATDRKQPRFPPEKEAAARKKIYEALQQEKVKYKGPFRGIAGAACGGDILFQESCTQLGIPSTIYLALPPEKFKKTSVSFAGKNWDERFDALVQKHPTHLLTEAEKKDKNIWEAANDEMLQAAMKEGGPNMTLIALWNVQGGDGPGGTQHLAEVAKASGATVIIISTQNL